MAETSTPAHVVSAQVLAAHADLVCRMTMAQATFERAARIGWDQQSMTRMAEALYGRATAGEALSAVVPGRVGPTDHPAAATYAAQPRRATGTLVGSLPTVEAAEPADVPPEPVKPSRGKRKPEPVTALAQAPKRRPVAERLAPRELEVVRWLAQDLTQVEAAAKMGISPLTAKSHVRRAQERLDISTAYGVVGWAAREGMLGDPYLPPLTLTLACREALDTMSWGMDCIAAARVLHVSPESVRTRVSKLRALFGASHQAGIVARAHWRGMLSDEEIAA